VTTVLAYTSPARGHLNPMMGPLLELRRRGHRVHVRTLSASVEAVRAAGLECEPLDPRIEAIEMNDHRERTQLAAVKRSFAVWAERAPYEVADLRAAIAAVHPDLVLTDVTTFGAKAVAEADGLRWAESRPFLLDDAPAGIPPFGLGLRPRTDLVGRVRDRVLSTVSARFDATAYLPAINAGRRAAGLDELRRAAEGRVRAPVTLYFTAEPFEYRRPLPPGVVMVGAGLWDPEEDLGVAIPVDDRPLVLVACSSEFQDDGAIAEAALAGLTGRFRVVVTSAGVDPAGLPARGDAVVARFLPHRPLLERASAVVCHGGMGITQKALAHGVPVCVVPWARDQLDVAAHVETAGAGVEVPRGRLSPERLAAAVERTLACAGGAARAQAGYEATGGAVAAADALERAMMITTPPAPSEPRARARAAAP
jgi:MGT family glycosyltransferase